MSIMLLGWLWFRFAALKRWNNYGNMKSSPGAHFPRRPPKPEWVRKKIVHLKALMPQAGCRIIAHAFNRLHERRGMTVGKSYVNEVIRKHRYEIQVLQRRIKHRRPRPVPHNLVWGIDLTEKTGASGRLHNILGIVEQCLMLASLADKASVILLNVSLPPSSYTANRSACGRTMKRCLYQGSFASDYGCSVSNTREPGWHALAPGHPLWLCHSPCPQDYYALSSKIRSWRCLNG